MKAEERAHPRFALQPGNVDVEVEAVDSLHLQGDPVAKDLCDATRYTHLRLRLTRSLGTICRLPAQTTDRAPRISILRSTGASLTTPRSQPPHSTLHLVGLRRSLVRCYLLNVLQSIDHIRSEQDPKFPCRATPDLITNKIPEHWNFGLRLRDLYQVPQLRGLIPKFH